MHVLGITSCRMRPNHNSKTSTTSHPTVCWSLKRDGHQVPLRRRSQPRTPTRTMQPHVTPVPAQGTSTNAATTKWYSERHDCSLSICPTVPRCQAAKKAAPWSRTPLAHNAPDQPQHTGTRSALPTRLHKPCPLSDTPPLGRLCPPPGLPPQQDSAARFRPLHAKAKLCHPTQVATAAPLGLSLRDALHEVRQALDARQHVVVALALGGEGVREVDEADGHLGLLDAGGGALGRVGRVGRVLRQVCRQTHRQVGKTLFNKPACSGQV